jgi:hypothetical protein
VRIDSRGPRCIRSLQQRQCARKQATIRDGSVRLTLPKAGIARFGKVQGAAPARSFRGPCPEEPEDIRSIQTDLGLADAPLSASDVFSRRVPRFFITGNSTQETTIEGDYDGRVVERVQWTLTFTRVR